jgi:hypothetical protein
MTEKPDWDTWLKRDSVGPGEAVWLSLDVEPDTAGKNGFEEGEANKRFRLICDWFNIQFKHSKPLRGGPYQLVLCGKGPHRVDLRKMAEKATEKGMRIPHELAALSKTRQQSNADKPIKETERDTLLLIVAGVCHNARIDLSQRGLAKQVAIATEELGAPVSEDTVRRHLSNVKNALETRMK